VGGNQWAMREGDLRGDRKVEGVSHVFGYLGKKVEGVPDTCQGPEAGEHPLPLTLAQGRKARRPLCLEQREQEGKSEIFRGQGGGESRC